MAGFCQWTLVVERWAFRRAQTAAAIFANARFFPNLRRLSVPRQAVALHERWSRVPNLSE